MSELRVVVVMGVSGSGKSTVARALAERLRWELVEGDELHPPSNVATMAAGLALTDADRLPWLEAIGREVDARVAAGACVVVTCSALRRRYRDRLRAGRPTLAFAHLVADRPVLERRLAERSGHFMPASLLPSQLADLEPLEPDEPGVTVSSQASAATVAADVARALGLPEPAAGSSAPDRPLD